MLIKQRPLPAVLPDLKDTPPLLVRIYAARHVVSADETNKNMACLLTPDFKDIDQATQLLTQALEAQKHVLIVGDFDADGATATAVAILGLKMLGFKQVSYLVPNRFKYGYGLTPEIVELAKSYNPDVLITVDNGIASHEGVLQAKKMGMTVIITDHHLPAETLPLADAIINPNQSDCPFKSKVIAGVGVIFYLLIHLRTYLRSQNWFTQHQQSEPNLAELLDLVALGTVADVVPLDSNNRRLIHHGLKRIQKGATRPAIKALLQLTNRDISKVTAKELGFILGPRLNAAGRLDDMSLGIDSLLCDDYEKAYQSAQVLHELNSNRKQIESGMQQEAFQQINHLLTEDLPNAICLYQSDWHQGVIGILASRVKDKFYRPTIIFADAEEPGILKGSARSINGFHIKDALERVAAKHPYLISKFGGHAMAAGLSLQKEHLDAFIKAFQMDAHQQLDEADLQDIIYTDGSLHTDEFTLQHAKLLEEAGPWGQLFPEPVFEGIFNVEDQFLLKEKHLKFKLTTQDRQKQLSAIAFNVDRSIWPNPTIKQVRIIYRLTINQYNHQEELQLVISHLSPIKANGAALI